AQNMGDLHIQVVNNHAEVVSGGAVRTGNDQIIQLAVVEMDGALDQVVPRGYARQRVFKAYYRLAVCRYGWQLFARFGSPGAIVTRLKAGRPRLFAHGVDFFGAAVAM